MNDTFLWVEKYRPKTVAECVLPEELKKTFEGFVAQAKLPNMILAGSPGCGKTTIARAMCAQINADVMFINGSDESGIDVLRNKIKQFASSVSWTDSKKVVIIDEADYLNAQSTQPAMRAFLEEFSDNCTFILTCNYKNKIIEPLHSRCAVIEFKIPSDEKKSIAKQIFLQLKKMLDAESIQSDDKVLSQLIIRFFPDFRRLINEIQRFTTNHNSLNEAALSLGVNIDVSNLMKVLKTKNYAAMRQWVVENLNNDTSSLYRQIYDSSWKFFKPESIPQLVLLHHEYLYKSAFVADPEVNLLAYLTEVTASCEIRPEV